MRQRSTLSVAASRFTLSLPDRWHIVLASASTVWWHHVHACGHDVRL